MTPEIEQDVAGYAREPGEDHDDPYAVPDPRDKGRGFWERDVYRALHGTEMPETLDPEEQERRRKDVERCWSLSRSRTIRLAAEVLCEK